MLDGRNRKYNDHVLDLVNYSLSSVKRQTGYTMGVTVRLESALDLVKKKRSVRRRDTGENHATKAY